ncbi:hypothetical protein GCM10011390_03770 [Aureimonas endophytica]|uniref:DUF3572 family protein n=1 Tax=Aureimonas endophytica TaxID=2027858 RepID=A0A916ZCC1_9HYPH|nr:DUF3572 domain-containing protein [Aureimonas endophytica]GGD88247.1 hypothetical protein GCM10011390_03770 [Aureimonas endophytica]
MLKSSRQENAAPTEDAALGIGIAALQFLAAQPELLERFLALSGLDPHGLRREAQRPAFFAGLLDFMLDHEPTLDAFAAHAELPPERIVAARAVLARAFGTVPR